MINIDRSNTLLGLLEKQIEETKQKEQENESRECVPI